MHLAQHLFDDIIEKGVTRNYTSKTFEKMHGPLKDSYKRRTNFKHVASQVGTFLVICLCQWVEGFLDTEG